MSIEISPEKIKPFDPSLALIMSNLGNGRVSKIFNNSVSEQKLFFFIA